MENREILHWVSKVIVFQSPPIYITSLIPSSCLGLTARKGLPLVELVLTPIREYWLPPRHALATEECLEVEKSSSSGKSIPTGYTL